MPAFGNPITMKDKKGNGFLRYGASGTEIDGDFSTYEPAVSFPGSFCYILNRKMFFKFLPMKLAGNSP